MANTKDGWVIWKGDGLAFEGKAGTGFTLPIDKPKEDGGGTGYSPMELVLVGLAGCTGMDVISILTKKRQHVTGFEVRAHGVRAEDHPHVFTDITVEYIVRGHQVEPEAVARAIELSETKYCSAMAMLSKASHITTTFRIEEEESK